MTLYAILDGKDIKPVSADEWAVWFKNPEARRVARTESGDRLLSTVFLGMDHGYDGKEQWFETCLFHGSDSSVLARYATYDEAVQGHERYCRELFG